MKFCVLCWQRSHDDFCTVCDEGLSQVELEGADRVRPLLHSQQQVISSFAYRGLARQCILASKTQGFRRVGFALCRRVLQDDLKEWAATCDVIMPAPSSLWSRARGSLDLAAMLAGALAVASGRTVQNPPWLFSFRWKKQALRASSQRRGVFRSSQKIYDASYFRPHVPAALRSARLKVLIVDDIVTSGSTLSELAACFDQIDFCFYTLASAYRSGKDYHAEHHSGGTATTDAHDAPGL